MTANYISSGEYAWTCLLRSHKGQMIALKLKNNQSFSVCCYSARQAFYLGETIEVSSVPPHLYNFSLFLSQTKAQATLGAVQHLFREFSFFSLEFFFNTGSLKTL